jgi:uncharacterized damage-inducible protein DinB
VADFSRLLEYDRWANREALASLHAARTPPPRSLKVMAHIVAAEVLWHARLTRERSPLAVWPELTVAQCETWLEDLDARWRKFLAAAVPGRLGERIEYTNSRGEAFTSSVEDVLTHVVIHSAYHRGQIAADVRAAGYEPAYTDFIHATRTGRVR